MQTTTRIAKAENVIRDAFAKADQSQPINMIRPVKTAPTEYEKALAELARIDGVMEAATTDRSIDEAGWGAIKEEYRVASNKCIELSRVWAGGRN